MNALFELDVEDFLDVVVGTTRCCHVWVLVTALGLTFCRSLTRLTVDMVAVASQLFCQATATSQGSSVVGQPVTPLRTVPR